MRATARRTALILGALIVLGAAGWLVLWPLATALAGPNLDKLPPKEQIDVISTTRAGIGAFLGFVIAGVPLVLAALKFVFERDKHYGERLGKAVEQSTADKAGVRAGGIQTLEEMLHERHRDSNRKRDRILRSVTSYLRGRRLTPDERPEASSGRHDWIEPADVTAAIGLLRDRGPAGKTGDTLDLRGLDVGPVNLKDVDLACADLSYAQLNGADLTHTDLTHARLHDTKLNNADLTHVILAGATATGAELAGATARHADLRRCNLTDTDLHDADLTHAQLDGAILVNTDLRGADLRHVTGLTDAQLRRCRTDAGTTLPPEL